jgi:peroxiredoxin
MKIHPDLQIGSKFPNFELPDQEGNRQQLSQWMRGFPTAVIFYRGVW